MRTPVILRLIGSAARAWWDDDCTRLGASIAYYTLFAIAPVLLVATAIAGMVFGAEAVRGEIVGQLDHLVGREGALAVQSLLEGASQRRSFRRRTRRQGVAGHGTACIPNRPTNGRGGAGRAWQGYRLGANYHCRRKKRSSGAGLAASNACRH